MRFVATKTPEQQSRLTRHRTRYLFIRQQAAVINAIRAHLAEFGIVATTQRRRGSPPGCCRCKRQTGAGVAAFQVVTHFVRLDPLLIEDLAHRALNHLVEAGAALRWPMLTSVAGQKPGRPQLVEITQLLRLPAGQRHQRRFGLGSDLGLFTRPRTLLERRNIRARSTRLAGSVRDRAIDISFATSTSLTVKLHR
jgi:hypothetical protein